MIQIQSWVKESLRASIHKAIYKEIKYFISGGAIGVDQWAAEILLEIKKQNRAVNLFLAKPFAS